MKKMFLTFAVAGLVFGLTSCKKDYTCTCDGTVVGEFKDVKKGDAEDACDAFNLLGTYNSCEVEKN